MFMHMPTKWAVLVWVVVVACLGAYYVLVAESERVGDWRVYQGSARCLRDAESHQRYLDVSYTVKHPSKPLFSYVALLAGRHARNGGALRLDYQSEWPTTLLVVVHERDGSTYQTPVEILHREVWTAHLLTPGAFKPRASPAGEDENGVLDFDQLAPRVDFYDGSGVIAPSTTFSNRLKLTPPVLGQTSAP